MLIAKFAILLDLELAGLILLVFRDGIVPPLAFLTRQKDYLTHTSLPAHVKSIDLLRNSRLALAGGPCGGLFKGLRPLNPMKKIEMQQF